MRDGAAALVPVPGVALKRLDDLRQARWANPVGGVLPASFRI